MIAVALGLISLVVMVATSVVASSGTDDHLAFLGVGIQTTTAQVFVTGAIFGWLFLVAIWLLRIGIHRSSDRCAELAARRSRRSDAPSWGGWDEWSAATERHVARGKSGLDDGGVTAPGLGGTGPARHGGDTPWRSDSHPRQAHRPVAGASEQPGMLGRDRAPGPVTGRRPGVGVNRRTESGQIGRRPGPVPGEDRRPEGEHRRGDGGQQGG